MNLFFSTFFLLAYFLSSSADARSGGTSNAFNPDLSLNTLFQGQNSTHGNDPTSLNPNGFSLNEAEIALMSDVDVYARLVGIFSITQDKGDWKISPEEAYAESLSFPLVTLKIGKFKAALGKYNQVHTHAWPFIDNQLINTELLTSEGLNSTGVSAALFIPLPWFSEIVVQGLSAPKLTQGTAPFDNTSPNALIGVARLRNLFDLSDSSTLEFAFSGGSGPNAVDKRTNVGGADMTFKWRPVEGGKYRAFIWSTEFLSGLQSGDPVSSTQVSDIRTQGGSTFVQYQFAERWWIQGRTEYEDQKTAAIYNAVKKKNSALIGFLPTEFSGFRLQYDHLEDSTLDKPDNRVIFQVNLSIGAHPAHTY